MYIEPAFKDHLLDVYAADIDKYSNLEYDDLSTRNHTLSCYAGLHFFVSSAYVLPQCGGICFMKMASLRVLAIGLHHVSYNHLHVSKGV